MGIYVVVLNLILVKVSYFIVFLPALKEIKLRRIFLNSSIGGSKGALEMGPPLSAMQFSIKLLLKNRLASPPLELVPPPPIGKSWIRHCFNFKAR